MIYSPNAIDYEAGFDVDPITKVAKPRKIGCLVLTLEECEEYLRQRRK